MFLFPFPVFRLKGIQQLQFGMAAAVNITKSFFSLALLLLANAIVSKLSDGYGLF